MISSSWIIWCRRWTVWRQPGSSAGCWEKMGRCRLSPSRQMRWEERGRCSYARVWTIMWRNQSRWGTLPPSSANGCRLKRLRGKVRVMRRCAVYSGAKGRSRQPRILLLKGWMYRVRWDSWETNRFSGLCWRSTTGWSTESAAWYRNMKRKSCGRSTRWRCTH